MWVKIDGESRCQDPPFPYPTSAHLIRPNQN